MVFSSTVECQICNSIMRTEHNVTTNCKTIQAQTTKDKSLRLPTFAKNKATTPKKNLSRRTKTKNSQIDKHRNKGPTAGMKSSPVIVPAVPVTMIRSRTCLQPVALCSLFFKVSIETRPHTKDQLRLCGKLYPGLLPSFHRPPPPPSPSLSQRDAPSQDGTRHCSPPRLLMLRLQEHLGVAPSKAAAAGSWLAPGRLPSSKMGGVKRVLYDVSLPGYSDDICRVGRVAGWRAEQTSQARWEGLGRMVEGVGWGGCVGVGGGGGRSRLPATLLFVFIDGTEGCGGWIARPLYRLIDARARVHWVKSFSSSSSYYHNFSHRHHHRRHHHQFHYHYQFLLLFCYFVAPPPPPPPIS